MNQLTTHNRRSLVTIVDKSPRYTPERAQFSSPKTLSANVGDHCVDYNALFMEKV